MGIIIIIIITILSAPKRAFQQVITNFIYYQGRRSWGGWGGRVPPSFLSGGDEYLIIPPTF